MTVSGPSTDTIVMGASNSAGGPIQGAMIIKPKQIQQQTATNSRSGGAATHQASTQGLVAQSAQPSSQRIPMIPGSSTLVHGKANYLSRAGLR